MNCDYLHFILNQSTPGCFVFLVNQSGSMKQPFPALFPRSKSEIVPLSINGLLQNLVVTCTLSDGVRPFVDVGVIGYRTDPQGTPRIESCLQPPLSEKPLVSIREIEANVARIETVNQTYYDPDTGNPEEMLAQVPIWVDPVAEGAAPLCTALDVLYPLLKQWCDEHPWSFPPVVFHLTDGSADDGDPSESIEELKRLRTTEKARLLWMTTYLCTKKCEPQLYPAKAATLPDQTAKQLWQMSSIMPPDLAEFGRREGMPITEGSRLMTVNADWVNFLQLLDWGSGRAGRWL